MATKRVELIIGGAGSCVRFAVMAEETATPGLVVHETRDAGISGFAVTVESAGIRVAWARTKETARLIAGALGGLPVKWNKIPKVSTAQQACSVVDIIHDRVLSAPKVWEWLRTISTQGGD